MKKENTLQKNVDKLYGKGTYETMTDEEKHEIISGEIIPDIY